MTNSTFSWNPRTDGFWAVATNWNPASIPNANNADVFITVPPSFAPYGVTLRTAETVDAVTLNMPPATLIITGTLILANASSSLNITPGSLQINASGSIGGQGQITGSSFFNAGTM